MNLVNPNSLKTFRELMEPDELKDFLKQVHKELWRAHSEIKEAYASDDWQTLQKLTHRLKGSLGSAGCDALYAVLHQLDEQLRCDLPQPPASQQMAHLFAVIETTARHLQEI